MLSRRMPRGYPHADPGFGLTHSPPRPLHRHPLTWILASLLAIGVVTLALTMSGGANGEARADATSAADSSPVSAAVSAPVRSPNATLSEGTGTLNVVALGDSVPSGSACHCTPFPDLVASRLATLTGRRVVDTNLAVGGLDSSELLDQLDTAATRSALRGANVVLIEIGANDFDEGLADDPPCARPDDDACEGATLRTVTAHLATIVDRVRVLQQPSDAQIVLMGYWNVFRDGQVGQARGPAYVAWSAQITDLVNAAIATIANEKHVRYADAYTPFKGRSGLDPTDLLAADGNHPNATGHEKLASAVVTALGLGG